VNVTAKGKITVATPGTHVAIETAAQPTAACKIHLQAPAANTGKTYIGTTGMVKATLAGVIHVFAIPLSTGPLETLELESHADEDRLQLAQYAIDADVAGEGLLVSYWVE
jgi:hypothetical protein